MFVGALVENKFAVTSAELDMSMMRRQEELSRDVKFARVFQNISGTLTDIMAIVDPSESILSS